jgi:sn-glycerol 3-phosphate transport system ATP-binding protein
VSGITVRNLVKRWGSVCAVDNVSFETGSCEFVALLGPSGCGKSTTLRLIAGLELATSGTVSIAGRDVTSLPSSQRNLSMVFQSYALFPHMTVAENIVFGLSVRGTPKAQCQQRLARVADLLGLSALLDRRPSQLSGGQQQRVALGRALIAETPVCLLDEPLSNLDAKLRAEMRNEIRSLQRRLRIAMVFVTHDQTEAMSMADRVILMREGRMEQSGTPTELYEEPVSTFAARFIGTPPMNILDIAPSGKGWVIDGSAQTLPNRLPQGQYQMGVRPEHIRFSESGCPALVESTEYFGADTITTCRVGNQRLLVRTSGRAPCAADDAVFLSWPESAQHFFDKSSGLRCTGLEGAKAPS